MTPDYEGRWPPVYDASQLAGTIQDLVTLGVPASRFYAASLAGPPVCQGDIVHLPSSVPLLDRNGEPTAVGSADYWLVVGNTCDFARDRVLHTQLSPIVDFSSDSDITPELKHSIRRYETIRSFFLPPWQGEPTETLYVADLCELVTAEKAIFDDSASVHARLRLEGWVLLHSCLVRFLCRDDGRFDP